MLQECDRMNMLLAEILRSLNELKLGLQVSNSDLCLCRSPLTVRF